MGACAERLSDAILFARLVESVNHDFMGTPLRMSLHTREDGEPDANVTRGRAVALGLEQARPRLPFSAESRVIRLTYDASIGAIVDFTAAPS